MVRKCSKEYSIVFIVEGEKFTQVSNLPSNLSSLLSVLMRTRSAQRLSSQHLACGPDAKRSRACAFWFFSVHNHGFRGGPNTFFQEKHPCLRNTVTYVEANLHTASERERIGACEWRSHARATPIRQVGRFRKICDCFTVFGVSGSILRTKTQPAKELAQNKLYLRYFS